MDSKRSQKCPLWTGVLLIQEKIREKRQREFKVSTWDRCLLREVQVYILFTGFVLILIIGTPCEMQLQSIIQIFTNPHYVQLWDYISVDGRAKHSMEVVAQHPKPHRHGSIGTFVKDAMLLCEYEAMSQMNSRFFVISFCFDMGNHWKLTTFFKWMIVRMSQTNKVTAIAINE